jgi:tetratricopeptide (TPR) repeat protein
MARDPAERYPSVDELGSEIRRELGIVPHEATSADVLWPISGIDAVSNQLLEAAQSLAAGQTLRLEGPPGSGRSALIRRLAWWLGVLGRPVAWIDDASSTATVVAELSAHVSLGEAWVLIDDADGLDEAGLAPVQAALAVGARLIVAGGTRFEAARVFAIPPLAEPVCLELVRRVVPSLTLGLQKRLVQLADGRPGALRRLARLIANESVASAADFDRVVGNAPPSEVSVPERPLERAIYYLDRGRFNDASAALSVVPAREIDASVPLSIAKARLELSLGEERQAFERLDQLAKSSQASDVERQAIELLRARARIGLGDYTGALSALEPLSGQLDAIGTEALAYHGLAQSLAGNHEQARQELLQAAERAQQQSETRLEALSLASLGIVLQRADRTDEARDTYRRALVAAERASDAGLLATVQTNLAGLLKVRGDIAGAIELYEAAVDMGRRSGRRSTVRQALLNLANNDLYLGRFSRAQSSLETLREQSAHLPKNMLAQLFGLEGELLGAQGRHVEGAARLAACAGSTASWAAGSMRPRRACKRCWWRAACRTPTWRRCAKTWQRPRPCSRATRHTGRCSWSPKAASPRWSATRSGRARSSTSR